ncbi:dynein regulatory complex protein 9 [Labeo rohita]|uniref:dynein regulatory complex protein 9 n=1 Tax=Labeo rohita TaxID=84645 RepID=UPI0021E1CFA6|nr:dynein regulatory complex protein 9 [Labeo rohita]
MMSVEMLCACSVLQDCADQLAVMGNIIGANTVKTKERTASDNSSTEDCEQRFTPLSKKLSIQERKRAPERAKVQKDWQFASDVINGLLVELKEKNTCHSLFSVIEEERKKKAQLLNINCREEESRLRVEELQKKLLDIKMERNEERERLEKEIAYLKDQLDTIGVKSNRQRKFVKSCAEQLVCQEQNLNRHKEKELEDEVTMLQKKTEEERKVHKAMEAFLERQHADLQKKLHYWKQRYEKDMNTKKQEITELQTKRNVIRERIQELSVKCKHMEEVIIEDRMMKERLRAQLEKEQREGDAATRIQAWWRGILVRRGLRSPKKADKSKSKAGKKPKKAKKNKK